MAPRRPTLPHSARGRGAIGALATTLSLALLLPSLSGCGAPSDATTDTSGGGKLLGRLDFPNSGATDAQEPFLRGVLYLHNFEYDDAARAFQAAQELDPDFAMAIWGEAMTHNHPIWMQQDRDAAIAALEKLGATAEERLAAAGSEREAGYLDALHVLYGLTPETADLDKQERDDRYASAMERLAERWPEDDEARAFHALAILGTAHEGRDFRTYMQAAAEAQKVWSGNDQHPGAAHYLIHSFDDPVHAPLGLPMARTYAAIAPDAAHAQHMTSHIFVALGLWDDVATANEAARRVQQARERELGETETVCGHYPYWLQYAYLQQGRFEDAREVLANCEERIRAEDTTERELWHYGLMRGRQAVDGGGATELQDPETNGSRPDHLFLDGFLAAGRGDREALGAALAAFRDAVAPEEGEPPHPVGVIQVLQLEGLAEIADGRTDAGLDKLREATDRQDAMPYAFGPPEVLKPAWELLGEQLLAADRPAVEAFQRQLVRTPRRVQALSGLADALEAEDRGADAARIRTELQGISRSGADPS